MNRPIRAYHIHDGGVGRNNKRFKTSLTRLSKNHWVKNHLNVAFNHHVKSSLHFFNLKSDCRNCKLLYMTNHPK